jgi:Zn-dependent membrane protease YugP
MSDLALYLVFLVPPLVFGLLVQAWLRRTVAREMQAGLGAGLSGAEVARAILDRNGLHAVPIERAGGGPLSDHYDPRRRSVHLSESVHDGHAVASAAIAAHEVGHALQHERGYAFFRARAAMWPAVAFASNAWLFLLLIGALMGAFGLVQFAIVLFAVVVAFQLVTLPVEFDASRRAKGALRELGLVGPREAAGTDAVLRAAAFTYVAAALAAITQLLYFALAFLGED